VFWDTEDPHVTRCFEGSSLVFVPFLVLLVSIPYLLKSSRDIRKVATVKSRDVNWMHMLKLV
jgi:hypothetical protein